MKVSEYVSNVIDDPGLVEHILVFYAWPLVNLDNKLQKVVSNATAFLVEKFYVLAK